MPRPWQLLERSDFGPRVGNPHDPRVRPWRDVVFGDCVGDDHLLDIHDQIGELPADGGGVRVALHARPVLHVAEERSSAGEQQGIGIAQQSCRVVIEAVCPLVVGMLMLEERRDVVVVVFVAAVDGDEVADDDRAHRPTVARTADTHQTRMRHPMRARSAGAGRGRKGMRWERTIVEYSNI